MNKQIEELTIELDAMRTAANSLKMHYENARADTARKMHSMIKERCIKGGLWPAFIANVVDTVAKELSEVTSEISPPQTGLVSLDDVSAAIKQYCCDLIDAGKDVVEITEFNADLQKMLQFYIGEKENGTTE